MHIYLTMDLIYYFDYSLSLCVCVCVLLSTSFECTVVYLLSFLTISSLVFTTKTCFVYCMAWENSSVYQPTLRY